MGIKDIKTISSYLKGQSVDTLKPAHESVYDHTAFKLELDPVFGMYSMDSILPFLLKSGTYNQTRSLVVISPSLAKLLFEY